MDIQTIYQLFLTIFLGALIGLEREYKRKEAGLQTYSLVSLGACLFTMISFELANLFLTKPGVTFDPSRVIQAIAVGIGFIGAGAILRQSPRIIGLTTATGLWVAAAVGVAVGAKLFALAVFATLLSLLVLSGFGLLEDKFFRKEE